jgi:hypothetical protein
METINPLYNISQPIGRSFDIQTLHLPNTKGLPITQKSFGTSESNLHKLIDLINVSVHPALHDFLFVLYNSCNMEYQIRIALNNNNDNDDPQIVGRSLAG